MYENYKDAIDDQLDKAMDHGYKLGVLLGQVEDEALLDELNYHLAKILGYIDDI